jgi:hypothetical protein
MILIMGASRGQEHGEGSTPLVEPATTGTTGGHAPTGVEIVPGRVNVAPAGGNE